LDKDAAAIRLFVEEKHELFVAQSFAKNMGLYNERVGNLTVVTNNSETIPKLKSQFTTVIRANYSNPPAHGARVAAAILNNKALNDEW
jgi:aspartate aminotransferase, cytoplasmic